MNKIIQNSSFTCDKNIGSILRFTTTWFPLGRITLNSDYQNICEHQAGGQVKTQISGPHPEFLDSVEFLFYLMDYNML